MVNIDIRPSRFKCSNKGERETDQVQGPDMRVQENRRFNPSSSDCPNCHRSNGLRDKGHSTLILSTRAKI